VRQDQKSVVISARNAKDQLSLVNIADVTEVTKEIGEAVLVDSAPRSCGSMHGEEDLVGPRPSRQNRPQRCSD